MPEAEIWTDGACSGNPGPGGWAYVVRTKNGETEGSGGEARTTNNQMELSAVLFALESLDGPHRVRLHSDSKYVVDGLRSWLDNWKRRGWRRADKGPVKNLELWQALDRLREVHDLDPQWVKAHNGHDENERCDRLAVAAAERAASGR